MRVDLRPEMKTGMNVTLRCIILPGGLMGSSFHPYVPRESVDDERETPSSRKPDRGLFGCRWGEDEHWLETQSTGEGDRWIAVSATVDSPDLMLVMLRRQTGHHQRESCS